MAFLNEVLMRNPEAIQFATGRPGEDTEEIDRSKSVRQVRTAACRHGTPAGQIRDMITAARS